LYFILAVFQFGYFSHTHRFYVPTFSNDVNNVTFNLTTAGAHNNSVCASCWRCICEMDCPAAETTSDGHLTTNMTEEGLSALTWNRWTRIFFETGLQ